MLPGFCAAQICAAQTFIHLVMDKLNGELDCDWINCPVGMDGTPVLNMAYGSVAMIVERARVTC
jgi:hypothetical protein